MKREKRMLAAAAAVLAVATVAGLVVPGAVSEPSPPESQTGADRTGYASIEEVTISADAVTGGTATLAVDTYLVPHGGPVENVTVVHRATDTETGLVENETEIAVGDIEDDPERVVSGSVSVPRRSDYELETFVYEDGTRTESVRQTVSGVGSLTPAYADSDVAFHRFGGEYGFGAADIPAVSYRIASTDGERATLAVESTLTNAGDETESGLELEVTARQSDSNVVADSSETAIGSIGAGETTSPSVALTVPAGYDYYLDATLWRDGTVVATERAAANLGPGDLTVESSDRGSGLEVDDFDRDDERSRDDRDDDEERSSDEATSGFGIVVAVVALLVGVVAVRGWSRD